jgi:hypothetical protein
MQKSILSRRALPVILPLMVGILAGLWIVKGVQR